MNDVRQLYNNCLNAYEKNYNTEKVKDQEERGRDSKQLEIIGNGDQEPKSTKKRKD